MNVEIEARRAVFVIEPKKETDNLALETIKGLYATSTKDYVTSVDENHIIYIKKLEYSKIQSISQYDKRKNGKISISGIVFFVNVQYFDDRRRLRLWIK